MNFTKRYIKESVAIIKSLDQKEIDRLAVDLAWVRYHSGRLFILGVGGSAATASHAVNDFRKIANMEAYAPTDNVAELTARTNDEGWETVFVEWLRSSHLRLHDALLILSVGGGSQNVSENLINAVDYAKQKDALVLGIVGRDGGHTLSVADSCVLISPLVEKRITPHTEGIASVVLHLLVSHPDLCCQ